MARGSRIAERRHVVNPCLVDVSAHLDQGSHDRLVTIISGDEQRCHSVNIARLVDVHPRQNKRPHFRHVALFSGHEQRLPTVISDTVVRALRRITIRVLDSAPFLVFFPVAELARPGAIVRLDAVFQTFVALLRLRMEMG